MTALTSSPLPAPLLGAHSGRGRATTASFTESAPQKPPKKRFQTAILPCCLGQTDRGVWTVHSDEALSTLQGYERHKTQSGSPRAVFELPNRVRREHNDLAKSRSLRRPNARALRVCPRPTASHHTLLLATLATATPSSVVPQPHPFLVYHATQQGHPPTDCDPDLSSCGTVRHRRVQPTSPASAPKTEPFPLPRSFILPCLASSRATRLS